MTSTISQRLPSDRRFEFTSTACASDTFAVVRMSGFEAICKPYRFELVLVSDDAQLDLARVLAAKAELRILAPDGSRQATPYAGVLAEFDQLHQAGGFTFYRAVLVPRLWQLSLYRNSEVYLHEQTIPEIVESLLKAAKLRPGSDYTLKLRGDYRPRSYVCQYQETPLAFISRWLEREGIYYYFEQADGAERLVLLDDRTAQPAAALAVNYRPADELDLGQAPDSVQGLVCRTRPLPRSLVLQDYNHRRAGMPLVTQVEVSASGVGEEMLYGENFRTEEEGQRYATIRAQELRCGARVFSGEATAVGLRSGHFMDLSHHYRDDFNGRYLVTEITHEGSQAGTLLAGLKTPFNEREEQTVYRNSFVALAAATQFRPARSTPKPRVAGTMSATVDAEGSGEYAELDAHGQYKVQIPFDRTEKGAAKGSAPVRMASPYAGSEHGMHFPLHKGTEVLLSFADGDPDQPVILGAVPNSVTPNVVDQRNPQDNLISTKGGNQMLMADTKGKEVIWLHSPFHKSSLGIGSVHPEGGGSIYEATTGGKDSVSFGNSNSMSFGPANSLSLGTKASIGAAFSNDVSMGTKIGIDASSSISWKANFGTLPGVGSFEGTSGLKNISIDDSDGLSLKRSFGGKSNKTAKIQAGAFEDEETAAALETSKLKLRAMIGSYTALNFTQSTVFSMAVNASADGALLGSGEKQAKKNQEADDLLFADAEAKAKAAEKDALKAETPPASVSAEAAQGTKDAAAWREAETNKISKKYENGPIESATEKAERNALRDSPPPADIARRAAAETVWRATKEKEIDDKYKSRAAAQAAPTNPARQTLQGWPGIIGKFGLDAVLNVTAMGLMQAYVRTLQAEIDDLKLMSELSLGVDGIQHTVNGDDAGAPLVQPDPPLDVRCELELSPSTGVSIKAGKKSDWSATPPTGGAIRMKSRLIKLSADKLLFKAPTGVVGHVADNKILGFSYAAADDTATLSSTASFVSAKADALKLAASTILIGNMARIDLLAAATAVVSAMETAHEAAELALEEAKAVSRAALKAARKSAALLWLEKPKSLPADDQTRLAITTAERFEKQARRNLDDALANEADAMAAIKAAPLTRGISIDDGSASLSFGNSGWKATDAGLEISCSSSTAKFLPVSVALDSTLIKLG
jgi:type VI secretion system VgrG family protein